MTDHCTDCESMAEVGMWCLVHAPDGELRPCPRCQTPMEYEDRVRVHRCPRCGCELEHTACIICNLLPCVTLEKCRREMDAWEAVVMGEE